MNYFEIVEILLAVGADISLKNYVIFIIIITYYYFHTFLLSNLIIVK